MLRVEFDKGYLHTRSRWHRSRRRYQIVYEVQKTDRDTLYTFAATTLRGGALTFTWTHPWTAEAFSKMGLVLVDDVFGHGRIAGPDTVAGSWYHLEFVFEERF